MFFFIAKDGTMLYMGKDKYENEDLIKYGWPEDVWFHVDALSSAHVYARLPSGTTMDSMSEDVIRDACQLVKENSIEGCKKASVTVVYTPWSNLKKDGGMAVGQVGFFNDRLVKRYVVMERDKETLRRLVKDKVEKYPDLALERKNRDEEERARLKAASRDKSKAEREVEAERKREKEMRSYDRLFAGKDREASSAAGAPVPKPTKDASAAIAYEEGFM